MSIFEDIIMRMMLACDVDKATELADFLGKNQSTISRWRDREKVPDGAIAQVAAMTKVNYSWLKTGEGEMRPQAGGIHANTNEPELVRTCEVEWSAGHHASEPLKLTHDEAMMVEFMRELDDQERADIMDTIREAWLLKRHKQNPTE